MTGSSDHGQPEDKAANGGCDNIATEPALNQQDRWTDPEGRNHSRVFIIAERVEFKPQLTGGKYADGEKNEAEDAEGTQEEQEETKEAVSFQGMQESEWWRPVPFGRPPSPPMLQSPPCTQSESLLRCRVGCLQLGPLSTTSSTVPCSRRTS